MILRLVILETVDSRIARLLAIQLELPEETFVNQYQFDAQGDTWCTS